MNKKALINSLKQYAAVDEKAIIEETIIVEELTFMQLRDWLIEIGTILKEDYDNHIYVISIAAGLANLNSAIIAIQLNKNALDCIGYAREGLINQHTAEKAINKIRQRIFKR